MILRCRRLKRHRMASLLRVRTADPAAILLLAPCPQALPLRTCRGNEALKSYRQRDAEHRANGIQPGHPLAPPDTLRMRWLVLKKRGCSEQELAQLEQQGKGRPRAMSPPFFLQSKLVSEYKWYGYGDSVFEVVPFVDVTQLFGMDVPFLEWVTELLSVCSERVIAALQELTTSCGVRICTLPYPTLPLPYPTLPYPALPLPYPPQTCREEGDMVTLLPGALRRPTASALQQKFWLIASLPTARCFVDSIGEPRWFKLLPCDYMGKRLHGGAAFNVRSTALNDSLSLSKELSAGEHKDKLLKFLLQHSDPSTDGHALSVRVS